MKRMFDLAAASIGLLLLSPLLLIVTILIKIKLGSPVLFKQKRPGLLGEPFYVSKFRTMTNKTDEHGGLLPNEERITKFGSILRKLSLDEFPQLLNVVKGDLSLVGPRPLLMEYLELYTPEQSRRHEVKPGITGWAQVNGRNAITWEDKFKLDVWYVDNQSFSLDMKILFLTIVKVFKSDGIDQQGYVSAKKFTGSTTAGESSSEDSYEKSRSSR
ncbi:sugar transferase [Salicibibacter halophilus]|uniref:Sugar transferase n=1 Tax=Salicibibacter halophilus TaxID=2502791 RepID=A0A514LF25_9BACI|nr:sugar transferase [Salicibibacter halophilus]QDI90454.1 sugar transferase [Salicibibacter halophilus]